MWPEISNREYVLTLPSVLKDYIPHQLLQDVDETKFCGGEEDLVAFYLKNSNDKLRLYGSSEELHLTLKFYLSFPLRFKKYPLSMADIENTTPRPYLTLKGEMVYCKHDVLFHLHHCVHNQFENGNVPEKLLEYMRNQTKRLDGCYEFVKYDRKRFGRIRRQFPSSQLEANFEKVYKVSELPKYPDEVPKTEEDFIRVFDELNEDYPTILLPNSETKDKNATAVVRIFEDIQDQKFVMESELFNAINLKNPDQRPLECGDREGYLRAIQMKDVFAIYRDELEGVDFIRLPVNRTREKGVPIATPSGDYCILASDAILELSKILIHSLNIFQKVKRNTWHLVSKYVKFLEKYFPPDMHYLYFMNLDLVERMHMETDEFWKQLDGKPVNSIRDVGPNQYTVEDFKKELKYLGLNDIFPEIISISKTIFVEELCFDGTNKFRTVDLYTVVERSIESCLFSRFSSLNRILHDQIICHQIHFVRCKVCESFKKQLVNQPNEIVKMLNKAERLMRSIEAAKVQNDAESSERSLNNEEITQEDTECNSVIPEVCETTAVVESSTKIGRYKRLNRRDLVFKSKMKELKIGLDKTNAARTKLEKTMIKLQKKHEEEKNQRDTVELVDKVEKMVEEQELEMTEMQKKFEENARKNVELQKGIKEKAETILKVTNIKNAEIEKLKRMNTKAIEERDEMSQKMKNKQTQAMNEKNKEISSLKLNISKLIEKNKKLTNELSEQKLLEEDRRKAEIAEKDQIIKEIQESTTLQISEQKRVNEQLQQTVSYMSTEYESQGKTVKRLLGQISSITDPKYSEDESCPLRRQLMGLRKMKDNLEIRSPLKLAKDISQRLISLSTRSEIQEMATYEYQQFEGKHQILLQEVIGNIQKLKENGDVLGFPPLPEYPSFSDKFVNEYWNEIEKQKASTSSESTNSGALEDSECLICFFEMKEEEKTLKCDHCRKILHLECASKWLKIHRSCPHCRREQLDPNEFPALH